MGLHWNNRYPGLATSLDPNSVVKALEIRRALLGYNPNLILVAEVRWHDAPPDYLPEDHPWWIRDPNGRRILGWEEGGFLKLACDDPTFRAQVAIQAEAVIRSGVFDGVFLDWANDQPQVVVDLADRIRMRVGDQALIIANTNHHYHADLAGAVNGVFMETYTNDLPNDEVRLSVEQYQKTLRPPALVCLEGWGDRNDLQRMRAYTTLALTCSDGYVLYSDPNPLPTADHLHNWYPFWDADLGTPTGPYVRRPDGVYERQFSKGTVLYNHRGNGPVRVDFAKKVKQVSSGQVATTFQVQDGDGDIFLRVGRKGDLEVSFGVGMIR